MRAMLLHELGGPVTFREIAEPAVGPNDAKVRIRAAGVGLTIIIMKSTPGLVTGYPRVPGHEIAGEVVEVGSEVRHVKAGDLVVCHFYLTCGACRFCRSGRETLCDDWRGYVGMACDGGYAEYMTVPAANLCHLPPGIPFSGSLRHLRRRGHPPSCVPSRGEGGTRRQCSGHRRRRGGRNPCRPDGQVMRRPCPGRGYLTAEARSGKGFGGR